MLLVNTDAVGQRQVCGIPCSLVVVPVPRTLFMQPDQVLLILRLELSEDCGRPGGRLEITYG